MKKSFRFLINLGFAGGGLVFLFLVLPRPVRADVLGQSQSFSIDKTYDAQGRTAISAALRITSEHGYFYVEDEYWSKIDQASRDNVINNVGLLKDEFENKIYPAEIIFFGPEPNPGIDNDQRITILLTPLVNNAGGYFDTSNEYPKSAAAASSNEREMVYLNILSLNNSAKINSFLAHEFQHLISFNQKENLRQVEDDTWINELRSEYAVTLLGYNDIFAGSRLKNRLDSFLADPSDSLTKWRNLPADYGQIVMFGEYLAERYSRQVIADTLKVDGAGITSLNQALAKNGFTDKADDIFAYWLTANYLNNSLADPRFGYSRSGLTDFHAVPTKTLTNLADDLALTVSDQIEDWQGRWYEISNFAAGQSNFLRIRFSSPSLTSFQVPYLVIKSDGKVTLLVFKPTFSADTLTIGGIGDSLKKVVLMPVKNDRLAGFTKDRDGITLTLVADRIKTGTQAVILPTPTPSLSSIRILAKPADFGLKEGDFIRAKGDNDIYIINEYGFKRLVLSPKICLQYGHLGKRGCFGAVKEVAPSVRDTFVTSWYFTNGETGDGRVYFLEALGEDEGALHHLNLSGAEFVSQGGNFNSVFLINSLEQKSYSRGGDYAKLPVN